MARFFAVFTSLCLVVVYGYAQPSNKLIKSDSLTYKIWTIDDGLPINTLNEVVQDNDGYLWLTSYDGIVRFDGLEFKTFNSNNTLEIPHNRATKIHKQDGVGIWISLEHSGVLLLNEKGFTHFGEEEGFSKSDVTQIYEDRDGRMFFITHDGHYTFENNKFNLFFKGDNEQQNRVRYVFDDVDASKWLATSNGLIHVKSDSVKEFNISEYQPENQIFSVFRTSDGQLLVSSSSGFFVLKNGEFTTTREFDVLKDLSVLNMWEHDGVIVLSSNHGVYTLKDGLLKKPIDPYRKKNETYINSMIDSDGLLWLVGNNGTLSIFKDQKITDLNILTKTGLDYFKSTYQDREGNIWITTPREGIIRIKKAEVLNIGKTEGLSEGNILGLLKDSKNRYWVGTRGGGVNIIDGDTIFHIFDDEKIGSQVVQTIAEDSLGNIWLGHNREGLSRISGSLIKEFKLGEKFDINNVHALYTSSDGQLWVGTYEGLIKFDANTLNHRIYTKEDGLLGIKIRYITEAKDGSLWIGTLDGGVSHFKDEIFTNYSTKQGLSSDNIRSIYIDKSDTKETIWIGTENNGLNRIKDGKINYVSTEDGLPNHNIHWISEDDKGWLWMSSNNGVIKIQKNSLHEYLDGKSSGFVLFVFGKNEGMRNPEGNGAIQEAGIKNDDGSFWFATQEGIAIINENAYKLVTFEPKVIIRSVTAKGQSFPTDSVIFKPNIDDFAVNVHAISFVNPEDLKFRYKLYKPSREPFKWIEIGKNRDIILTDISHGEYIFEVQATNQKGEWINKSAILYVKITPKYYEQIWFYFLLLLTLTLLIVAGWRYRYQRLIAKQVAMGKVIDEQVKLIKKEKEAVIEQKEIIEKQALFLEESNKTKDKFFSIIAHDLRNPFQSLFGYTELLYNDLDSEQNSDLKEGLGTIRDSAQKLFDLTENLLEWANLQTGKVTPHPRTFSLNKIIKENIDLFLQSADQKGIHLIFNEGTDFSLYADENMVKTVLRNLISNSIKFTKKDGKITVKVHCNINSCKILIIDTGIGMSKKLLDGLMNLDSNSTREGTNNELGSGLGLILCKEMVEMNFGSLEIESEENVGTTFTITLPCK